MEKNMTWHDIKYKSEHHQTPTKRWGHKTILIDDQLILFGGFSDVTYLNDLWAYNIHTNKWRQIKTTGKIPQGKSNFTMHYDKTSNQILIFGGGGPNKKRYNKISFLNWSTKIWTQFISDDQNSPWQRTYHSSEFKYPYLITFGGEGAANLDFDDLWAFNIITKQWKQIVASYRIKVNGQGESNIKSEFKIQGRRFHSTGLIDYQLFVVSGCRINYECLPNIHSINLQPFFKNETSTNLLPQANSFVNGKQDRKSLYWKQYILSQQQLKLIQRWGHSTQTYSGKLYIFGGRCKEDYNDLLQFDPKKCTLSTIVSGNNSQKLPKCRRRHSATMIGSSMVLFGGFNVQYFSDMMYISLFQRKSAIRTQFTQLDADMEIIQLQEKTFDHFMEEINKTKPEYDVDLFITANNSKNKIQIKCIEQNLRKGSHFFDNLMNSQNCSNPQRKQFTLRLFGDISVQTFLIFNSFLLKDILIIPKKYNLNQIKQFSQLLICGDYFLNQKLSLIIQKFLTIKVSTLKQQTLILEDILNLAAYWKMNNLLKLCTQIKIKNGSYCNTSNFIHLSQAAIKLKQKCLQQILIEVQFDQIQQGQKRKSIKNNYHKQIKHFNIVQQNSIGQLKNKKRSFVERFVQSFSKICSSDKIEGLQLHEEGKENVNSHIKKSKTKRNLNIFRENSSSSNRARLF